MKSKFSTEGRTLVLLAMMTGFALHAFAKSVPKCHVLPSQTFERAPTLHTQSFEGASFLPTVTFEGEKTFYIRPTKEPFVLHMSAVEGANVLSIEPNRGAQSSETKTQFEKSQGLNNARLQGEPRSEIVDTTALPNVPENPEIAAQLKTRGSSCLPCYLLTRYLNKKKWMKEQQRHTEMQPVLQRAGGDYTITVPPVAGQTMSRV